MVSLPYLKDKLATNVPETVTITKRVGTYPELDYTTKQPTGRDQTLYNFRMSTGEEVRHYAKEREEDTLKIFNAGERVIVTRKETEAKDGKRIYFLDWTAEGDITASAKPQLKSNTHEVRTAPKQQRDYELERDQKSIEIGLRGIAQALIIKGESVRDALKTAEETHHLFAEAAKRLANGVPKVEIDYGAEVDVSSLPF